MTDNLDQMKAFNPWILAILVVIMAVLVIGGYILSMKEQTDRHVIGSKFCATHNLEFSYYQGNTIRCWKLHPDGVYNFSDYLVDWNILRGLYGTKD